MLKVVIVMNGRDKNGKRRNIIADVPADKKTK